MRTFIRYFIILLFCTPAYAQDIESDIFNDLKFNSERSNYSATFKKNIFDDLIFSDNKGNVAEYKKEYLLQTYPQVLRNAEAKTNMFRQLIHDNRHDANYHVTYSVDIFGKVKIEDNRGNKSASETDIFGNDQYHETINGKDLSVNKELDGRIIYKSGGRRAEIRKDILDRWIYSDSRGNELRINKQSWAILQQRYGSETNAFLFLVDSFCF